jgi:RNA polymerase sigma-70 factor (ECF subfamily)
VRRSPEDAQTLLSEHGARLHALLLKLTLRYDVAEDLLQDLFCKLAQSPRFSQADDPLAYAIRMATNLAFDHRRARRPNIADLDAAPAAGQSPLADLVRREELDRVLEALGQLPAAAREIVVLRYLESQDYETIAGPLGKTPHQVRALCHKALERLRAALAVAPPGRPASKEPSK